MNIIIQTVSLILQLHFLQLNIRCYIKDKQKCILTGMYIRNLGKEVIFSLIKLRLNELLDKYIYKRNMMTFICTIAYNI